MIAMIKEVVARLGHSRSFPRRLPAELGGCTFSASLEGGSKYLKRDLRRVDPVLTSFATLHVNPGEVVWDVGANVGLFTFMSAGISGRNGRVLAVDPDVWLAHNIRRAAYWNPRAARVDVIAVAVADFCGLTEFNIAKANRAVNFLTIAGGSSMTGGIRETHHVPTVTLDSLLVHFPPPNVLKIDVEGAEVEVLRGATKVLGHRPRILIEVWNDHREAVHSLLAPFRYRYYDAKSQSPTEAPQHDTVAIVSP